MKRIIVVVVWALFFMSVTPPLQGFAADSTVLDPFTSLFLKCMTRSGVTAGDDTGRLRIVAYIAARSFQQKISEATGPVKLMFFRKNVGQLVNVYAKEYSLAPAGLEGAEERGAAFDRLLSGLLTVAGSSGIPLEKLDMAILYGAAMSEAVLGEYPLTKNLSLADQELVKLLLRVTVNQVHRRTVLADTGNALSIINAPGEVLSPYVRITAVLGPVLKRELVGIEQFMADPLNVADSQKLVTAQFNNDGLCDLFAFKYGMELLNSSVGLEAIVADFAARMPGMAPELLKELGVISDMLPLTTIAAYNSVTPELQLSYSPVSGFADKLVALGQMPPLPPDYAPFANPYLALFQVQYDIKLCDMITVAERTIAEDAAFNLTRPLSLAERFSLKHAAIYRLSQVQSQSSGIPRDIGVALELLLLSAQGMRL